MTNIPTPERVVEVAAPHTWSLGEAPWTGVEVLPPRYRVIVDNDFSGDPDDVFQLAHHALSPSVDIRLVVGSHLSEDDPFDPGPDTASHAVLVAREVFSRLGLTDHDRIVQGAQAAIPDATTPVDSPAARAIIAEALRDDTDMPLFYAAGGGLTDLASALLMEPSIASRLTVVWIGGPEHEGFAEAPPGGSEVEYNLAIDVAAAQVVFASEATIWQVPRDAYRRCLVSFAELRTRARSTGPLGAYLHDEALEILRGAVAHSGRGAGETYALGDQPLVLLTALQSPFEPATSSSDYVVMPTPEITGEGTYRQVEGARPMRVYTGFDTRMMFEDLYAKLAEHAVWQRADGL